MRDLPGNAVLLGSPLNGSRAASGVGRLSMLRPLIGPHALSELAEPCGRCWHGDCGRALGAIAGTRRLGTGQFFAHFDEENDGTVAVSETVIPGLNDHVVVPHSHVGMLFAQRRRRAGGAFPAACALRAGGGKANQGGRSGEGVRLRVFSGRAERQSRDQVAGGRSGALPRAWKGRHALWARPRINRLPHAAAERLLAKAREFARRKQRRRAFLNHVLDRFKWRQVALREIEPVRVALEDVLRLLEIELESQTGTFQFAPSLQRSALALEAASDYPPTPNPHPLTPNP